MTNYDPFNVDRESLRSGLEGAVEFGWIKPVRHGFCFYCGKEGDVHEVIDPMAPAQPPRCPECFIDAAMSLLDDPKAMEQVLALMDEELDTNKFDESP